MHSWEIKSPSQAVIVDLRLNENSELLYSIKIKGESAIDWSPLGLITTSCNFSFGLEVIDSEEETINESYQIPAFKKSICLNHCNCLKVHLQKESYELLVEARAYDDGGAVRLTLQGIGNVEIEKETTAMTVPTETQTLYAQKYLFTYEDHYSPVTPSELYQNRFAFPLLVRLKNSWALYAEAPVYSGNYGGGSLLSSKAEPNVLILQKSPDALENLKGEAPFSTPWRVAICGSLASIYESNLLENLNDDSIVSDPSFIQPGLSAWGWMVENSSAGDPIRMREYVDYASKMGYAYSLVDAGWEEHIENGVTVGTNIPDLVVYGAERHVKIWIWAHSKSLRDEVVARQKLSLWASWGIAGIKIDFFESDSQERIAQFTFLAQIAAELKLMLNFHGCSKPTGTSRVWPHVLSYEGVMGGEYLQNFSRFLPGGPDAAHNCTLPFTRNAVGPMDYTPLIYETYTTATTDTHQTALAVIFTSYIQHITEKPEIVLAHPCKGFLAKLPSAWDESHLLEGMPASFVTVARRRGQAWFLAGICARRPRNAELHLDFLEENTTYQAELYADRIPNGSTSVFDYAEGALPSPSATLCATMMDSASRPSLHSHDLHAVKTESFSVSAGETLTIPLSANGGFVLYLLQKK